MPKWQSDTFVNNLLPVPEYSRTIRIAVTVKRVTPPSFAIFHQYLLFAVLENCGVRWISFTKLLLEHNHEIRDKCFGKIVTDDVARIIIAEAIFTTSMSTTKWSNIKGL